MNVLGPQRSEERQLSLVLNGRDVRSLKVSCEPTVMWSFTVTDHTKGEEGNPVPCELPIDHEEETMEDVFRRVVARELSRFAIDKGLESIEEANDFDIEGDDASDFLTPYETYEMQQEAIPEATAPESVVEEPVDNPAEAEEDDASA